MDSNSFVAAMRVLWHRTHARMTRRHPSDSAMPYSLVEMLRDSLTSTLLCVNHYRRQLQTAFRSNATPVATEFLTHMREEEQIARQLTDRIAALGGDPGVVSEPEPSTPAIAGDSLIELMRENLIAERIAIRGYQDIRLAVVRDEVTRDLLSEIVTTKERYAEGLSDLLAGLVQVRDEEWDSASGRRPRRLPDSLN